MKLRLQENSVRLRLKRGEVEQLARTGRVEERIAFDGRGEVFHYLIEAAPAATKPHAILRGHGILVLVPADAVKKWAAGDDVGIEAFQPNGGEGELQVLIEKDFACLNGPEEQNVDTFPNPLAGTKC
jgi:hypothetical protein